MQSVSDTATNCTLPATPQPRAPFTPCAGPIKVNFHVPDCQLEFGQGLNVVGSAPTLGSWSSSGGAPLQWHEGNHWKGSVEIESDTEVEFKLVKVAGEESIGWEEGANRTICISAPSIIECTWGGETVVRPDETAEQSKKLRSAAGSAKKKADRLKTKRKDLSEKVAGLEQKVAKSSTKLKSIQESQTHEAIEANAPTTWEPVAVAVAEPPSQDTNVPEHHAEPEHSVPVAINIPEPIVDHAVDYHVNGSYINSSSSIELPPELAQLVHNVSLGADGSLMIQFSDTAHKESASALAAKLLYNA